MLIKKRFQGRKPCRFCADKFEPDYKDFKLLQNFLTEHSKIVPRRISGNCAFHQRQITREVKRARAIALVSFTPSRE